MACAPAASDGKDHRRLLCGGLLARGLVCCLARIGANAAAPSARSAAAAAAWPSSFTEPACAVRVGASALAALTAHALAGTSDKLSSDTRTMLLTAASLSGAIIVTSASTTGPAHSALTVDSLLRRGRQPPRPGA